MKHFRGYNRDGTTFGMDIETNTAPYRAIKKYTAPRQVTTRYGIRRTVRACPFQYVAGVMREAGWLVAEKQSFRSFSIDDDGEIFIEYPDGIHL